jgi:hypothetical protein
MPTLTRNQSLLPILLILCLLVVLVIVPLPPGIDWSETFRPVGQALYHLRSPYSIEGFRYLPWAALVTLPFAWLPLETASIVPARQPAASASRL